MTSKYTEPYKRQPMDRLTGIQMLKKPCNVRIVAIWLRKAQDAKEHYIVRDDTFISEIFFPNIKLNDDILFCSCL